MDCLVKQEREFQGNIKREQGTNYKNSRKVNKSQGSAVLVKY